MGGDVGEEVQRLVLKVVELVTSDGEEGVEEDTGRWGGDIVVEERRRRRECVLDRTEGVLDGKVRVVDIDLVGQSNFGPTGRGGDGGSSRGDGRILEEVFLKLEDVGSGRGERTKVEGHLVWLNSQLQY